MDMLRPERADSRTDGSKVKHDKHRPTAKEAMPMPITIPFSFAVLVLIVQK